MDLQVPSQQDNMKKNIKKTKGRRNKKRKEEISIPLCWSISVVSFGQVSITFTNAWSPGCSIALSVI